MVREGYVADVCVVWNLDDESMVGLVEQLVEVDLNTEITGMPCYALGPDLYPFHSRKEVNLEVLPLSTPWCCPS